MAGLWDFKPASTPARYDQRDTKQSQHLDAHTPSSRLRDLYPSPSPFSSEKKVNGWYVNGNNTNKSTPSGLQSRRQALPSTEDSTTPDLENGSSTDFLERYSQLKHLDTYKNNLIEELLYRYDSLNGELKKLRDDHERECEFNRSIQRREKDLLERNRQLQLFVDCDPFVLILIDGNGMVFRDDLLMKGEAGGKEAANLLHDMICSHLTSTIKDFPLNARVVTRVYASTKSLSDTCYRGGIIDRATKVEDFVQGFTRCRMLFDWIDVGKGKDGTDEKLSESMDMHIRDLRCRQIFIGCSHDNKYARMFESLGTEEYITSRITMLEGTPFEKDLKTLPFNTIKFGNLFRESKINVFSNPLSPLASTANGMLLGTPSPPLSRQLSQVSLADVKEFTPANIPLARVASISAASASNSTPGASPSLSWASAAAKAATVAPPPAITIPVCSSPTDANQVPRNRKGQRVDPIMKHDKNEVDRLKKLKLCNVHFLRGSCPYGDTCTHVHQYRPTSAETQTLRLVARMAPCVNGSECDDLKCIYGHICPAPEGRDGKPCIFGDACRFLPDLHKIDRQIVKIVKV